MYHKVIIVSTIITFLIGFLILNTANRAGCAEQVKLDIIIAALEKADNKYIAIEDKTVEELTKAKREINENLQDKNADD